MLRDIVILSSLHPLKAQSRPSLLTDLFLPPPDPVSGSEMVTTRPGVTVATGGEQGLATVLPGCT